MAKDPQYIATHLRQVLINGAAAPHTEEVERFFKEEITSRGWYTNELRKLARRFTKIIKGDAGLEYLVAVADNLFNGDVLEEKILAVQLLETSASDFTRKHFPLFESWLDRVSTWADHDALTTSLIGPIMVSEPKLSAKVFQWAKSDDRWHRRAAAVSLIRGVRVQMFETEVEKITALLLHDGDDMVQKGLGWLLREAAKYNRERTVPLLMKIREESPRLVLRTACETLPVQLRSEVLGITPRRAPKKLSPRKVKTSKRAQR